VLKKLLLASALVLPVQAQAAEITWWSSSSKPNIYNMKLSGDIEVGEYNKFRRVVESMKLNQPRVITIQLESRGGIPDEAIAIGRMIREYDFATYVADNTLCASSCALIWVAGQRLWGWKAYIGFHGVYVEKTQQPSPAGNALVGAYLKELGFNDAAINYMTHALPQEPLERLTLAKARQHGITALMCVNGQCQ
jgi:hypothetical protein